MGEAKQRRLAKATGKPWDRDKPPAAPPKPWYIDPESPRNQELRARRGVEVAPPPEPSPTMEMLRKHVEAHDDLRVVVLGKDPRSLPVRRGRPGTMELALLMAALGTEPLEKAKGR
jgi:hypothetical protein